MAAVILDINLSAFKYKQMYQGTAKYLVAQSRDGRQVQLPLSIFKSFVTHQGVFGSFEVEFDENRKLIGVRKLN